MFIVVYTYTHMSGSGRFRNETVRFGSVRPVWLGFSFLPEIVLERGTREHEGERGSPGGQTTVIGLDCESLKRRLLK